MIDDNFKKVLFNLMRSHSKLAKAEYDRDITYNNTHFSYIAEDEMIKYLQKNHPDLLEEFFSEY